MKRSLILVFILLVGIFASMRADEIITRSAESIPCTVTEINEAYVKYRKPGEKFDREIARTDIFKIKYENGEEDFLGSEKQSAPVPVSPASPATFTQTSTQPDWSKLPSASKVYHLGDWYDENGVSGVVVSVTPDGRHGRIMHPKKFEYSAYKRPKCMFKGPTNFSLGMQDMSNGYANIQSLKKFRDSHPEYKKEDFELLNILEELGDGWYIPSIEELKYFSRKRMEKVKYSGENTKFNGKETKWGKIFDSVAKAHDGKAHNDFYTLSSTEVYSNGGASVGFQAMFGDPADPGFCLLKHEGVGEEEKILPIIRNVGYVGFYAFHLF